MSDTSRSDLLYNLFSGFSDVVKYAERCLNMKMRLGNTYLALLSFVHEAFP